VATHTYSDAERGKFLKFILGALLASFIIGVLVGYSNGTKVANEREYQRGFFDGELKGFQDGEASGFKTGYVKGEVEGVKRGGKVGYSRGYDDRLHGRPNISEAADRESLGVERHSTQKSLLSFAAMLGVVLTLCGTPFVYFRGSSGRMFEPTRHKPFWYAFTAKLLISCSTLIAAWKLLPSYWLAHFGANMVDRTAIELSIAVCGAVIATVTGHAIWITIRGPHALIGQIIWSVLIPVIVYQLIGCVLAANSADTTFAIKMLQIPTGVAVGAALYWCYVLLRSRLEHETGGRLPRRRATIEA
jgi:hypothetical protein